MKYVKIAAGLCNVDYGKIGDEVARATQAGVDRIHAEAADTHVLTNENLMGGFRDVQGIRPRTHLPIELHCYIAYCDRKFINQVADAGANMILLPIDHFLGASPLADLAAQAHDRGMQIGLFTNCVTPAFFYEQVIYWIDRIHIVTHDISSDNSWGWRQSAIPMIKKLRRMIDEKKPSVELAADGGIVPENLAPLVAAGIDVMEFSRPVFEYPGGIEAGVRKIRAALDLASAQVEAGELTV